MGKNLRTSFMDGPLQSTAHQKISTFNYVSFQFFLALNHITLYFILIQYSGCSEKRDTLSDIKRFIIAIHTYIRIGMGRCSEFVMTITDSFKHFGQVNLLLVSWCTGSAKIDRNGQNRGKIKLVQKWTKIGGDLPPMMHNTS